MTKFSKIDLPDSPIRRAAAVATYMLWGIFRNTVMITWPDHALRAVWELTQSRFRFVRSGGAFAKWKACRRTLEGKMAAVMDKGRRKLNRAETADQRRQVFTGDRLLSKVMVKIRGVRIAALLFKATRNEDAKVAREGSADAGSMYPSAPIRVTQESTGRDVAIPSSRVRPCVDLFRHGLSTRLSRAGKAIVSWGAKIGEFARTTIRRLF